MFLLLLLAACTGPEKDTADTDTPFDTGDPLDTQVHSDSPPDTDTDTGVHETGETGDTAETGDTGDSGETADTTDTADTGEPDGLDPAARWEGETVTPDGAWALAGERADDGVGWVVDVGDADGDGQADLLTGAPLTSREERYIGGAWLVRGPILANMDLGDAATRYTGTRERESVGAAVALVGDFDGDGGSEVAISAPFARGESVTADEPGSVHIFAGARTGDLEMADANATWTGEDGEDEAGLAVVGRIDWTGDGVPDVAIGAAAGQYGDAYVLDGDQVMGGGSLDRAAVRIHNGDYRQPGFGSDVVAVGDLDGDGQDDLGVGWSGWAQAKVGTVGALALFRGPLDGAFGPADADALVHGASHAVAANAHRTAGVGDCDGDGLGDLLLGVKADGDEQGGVAYLLSGSDALDEYSVLFAMATFEGVAYSDGTGTAVTSPGDVDGDGFVDLLIGSPQDDDFAESGGSACLHYGPFSGSQTCFDAGAAWFGGERDAMLGFSLAAGQDLTGDSYGDLVLGARGARGGADWSGVVYVVPGLEP